MNLNESEYAMDKIDLRSDTVTWPTVEMREAMAKAKVGDDVFGDDPTVIELENEAARMFGKEAALLVPSGTQGNLLAIMSHCNRSDELICGNISHIFLHEAAGMSALAGVMPYCLPVQQDGTILLDDITNAIRVPDDHHPTTRLICIENTQNQRGGVALPPSYIKSVGELAHSRGLKLHIDGARIFNAAAACDCTVKDLAEHADSVQFCLSKGLCAPIGSMLVGSKDFIVRARKNRKMLGGGMRQAGFIAAAGLIGLRKMSLPERMKVDHKNATLLRTLLDKGDLPIRIKTQHTSFVNFELLPSAKLTAEQLSKRLKEEYNILLDAGDGTELEKRSYRCVIHYWITEERVVKIAEALRALLS